MTAFLAGDRVTLVYQDEPVSGVVKSTKEGRVTIDLADARCVDVPKIGVRRARPIVGTPVDKATLPEATWQRDLLYADGPLVSLLTAQNGDNYLWIWSDCDALGHRWVVIRVSLETLTALSDRVLSLKAALNAALDPDAWVVDWGGSGEVVALAMCPSLTCRRTTGRSRMSPSASQMGTTREKPPFSADLSRRVTIG